MTGLTNEPDAELSAFIKESNIYLTENLDKCMEVKVKIVKALTFLKRLRFESTGQKSQQLEVIVFTLIKDLSQCGYVLFELQTLFAELLATTPLTMAEVTDILAKLLPYSA
jgi:hypothetical protein